jgi:TusE/DsrC/DsvC family sulfur relay protein
MPTKTIAGKTVQVNDEGFMTNPAEWTREIAAEIAREEGIPELTPTHWKVIDYCRQSAATTGGKAPTLRTITTNAGVNTKELFTLFPKGPAKKVAHIAGLGKPEGCV